ncbi:diaminopimelate epimerase [Halothermothrix orenii]|uniref:Diaminopimelate epimerase n=1 Tax=Halothermothrix orenii (strain H 168 / OCM 544 / DSM 9562) TaxID=373903 RepID=DAPF_HALOH|nr:diaminopimelate epimerase [Halothermothrix orenii]B8CX90.1 RecName: Full=Diaminopimelate epimerase; Short=DAP epimerase; AltName: Full=PLP-independent amino acid racemase [Halothermothrix orenii H 168]ACL69909.1 Diaminopimelate epimerase [Halothermothrix orenii H 168]
MELSFTKMHGTGNDFIMVNGSNYPDLDFSKLARQLCRRHFSIGADGLIIVLPPESVEHDFRMRIFNADGSEAEMCGNGIRCFAHYLRENNLTTRDVLKIETLAGIITPEIVSYNGDKSLIKVNMGRPHFKSEEIPVNIEDELDYVKNFPLKIGNKKLNINCVSMGNPHTIIFVEDVNQIPVSTWGQEIEHNPLFPQKTNVEFIQIQSEDEIIMRVWERGSGITLACGTGACASVVAGIKNGLLKNMVTVHLPGGDLNIEWQEQDVFMTGPAESVYTGKIVIQEG